MSKKPRGSGTYDFLDPEKYGPELSRLGKRQVDAPKSKYYVERKFRGRRVFHDQRKADSLQEKNVLHNFEEQGLMEDAVLRRMGPLSHQRAAIIKSHVYPNKIKKHAEQSYQEHHVIEGSTMKEQKHRDAVIFPAIQEEMRQTASRVYNPILGASWVSFESTSRGESSTSFNGSTPARSVSVASRIPRTSFNIISNEEYPKYRQTEKPVEDQQWLPARSHSSKKVFPTSYSTTSPFKHPYHFLPGEGNRSSCSPLLNIDTNMRSRSVEPFATPKNSLW